VAVAVSQKFLLMQPGHLSKETFLDVLYAIASTGMVSEAQASNLLSVFFF